MNLEDLGSTNCQDSWADIRIHVAIGNILLETIASQLTRLCACRLKCWMLWLHFPSRAIPRVAP